MKFYSLQSLAVAQNPETDRLLSKLSSLFNKSQTNWIEVDLSPWGSDKEKASEFTKLKNAILNQQMIEFTYFNSSGEKSIRKVEPIRLMFKVNAWYLKGFCLLKNEYRTFKISRMSGIQIKQEAFIDRLPEAPPKSQNEQNNQNWIDVELWIAPHGAYRVFDEFSEIEITRNQDDSFTVVTSLPESEWLFHYILSFGADIEVLAPQNIREMIQSKLNEIMLRYNK